MANKALNAKDVMQSFTDIARELQLLTGLQLEDAQKAAKLEKRISRLEALLPRDQRTS